MESALGTLFSLAANYGLDINPNKTTIVLFSRKYKIEIFRLLRIGGRKLPLSSEVKYLGAVLDSKLNWKGNTKEVVKKGLNALPV